MAVHALLIVVSNLTAFWLRFDGEITDTYVRVSLQFLPWLLTTRLVFFAVYRLFEGLWKYTSLWDLRNILLGVSTSSVVFWIVTLMVPGEVAYPRSAIIIDAILLVCLMTGIRLTRRIYAEAVRPSVGRRVLIYGAGDAGELIVRDMRQNATFQAVPVGFIDDDKTKVGQRIHGVPVLGGRGELARIVEAYRPEELLLALPSASRETVRGVVRTLEPFKIRITTLPRLHDLIGTRVEVGQIRQLKVEDLLARDPIGLDYAPVRLFLRNKRVMVTGAGGSIGSELCRQIGAASPSQLILLDRYENGLFQIHQELSTVYPELKMSSVIADISDGRRMEQVFSEALPQVVFHAAAHKHVPLMEANPCEAIKNNVLGTRIVAEAAARVNVERFVLISTDKAVNPTSVMGSTKRVAELVVELLSHRGGQTRFAAVRFGNVLASNGSVVPTFLAQIAKGGPVTVTHPEMKRYFMLIPEAVQLVLQSGALADDAPLFVLDMGEQVKVADMARDLIRLSGLIPDKDIEIRFTGVRPGEKLFEELVGDGESVEQSLLDKVLRVQSTRPHDLAGLATAITRLEGLAIENRSDAALRELESLLSTFSTSRLESFGSDAALHSN